ncbi:glutamate racemase [bacterium]|nr:glutamate racemase [bacterium]
MINNDNTNPIGFFDSGVGGLSVLARFRKVLPSENVIYFGDTVHLPYGNKSKEELIGYAKNIIKFFKEKDVKAVVIACNTSSAQAYDTIKQIYSFPIYPIIQSCSGVIATSNVQRVGVFATESTVKSGKYTEELTKHNSNIRVKEMASKNWVGIVEGVGENIEDARKNIKYEIEEMLEFKPEKIVLGCTHYPYLMNEFVKYAPKELFIDPAEIFVDFIKQDLSRKSLLNNKSFIGKEEFFVTSSPEDFVNNAKIFYDVKNLPNIYE